MLRLIVLFAVGGAAALVISCLGLRTLPENPLGAVLVFAGLAYCAGGAVYVGLEKKEKAVLHELGDRSLWLLAPGFLAVLLGPPLEYMELPETLPRRDWMEG